MKKVCKKKVGNDGANLLDKVQYGLLLAYLTLVYVFNGNEDYNILIYIPLALFVVIELGWILINRTTRINKYLLALFLFVFVCFLSCVWAQHRDLAMSRAITVLLLVVALSFMYNYCIRTKKSVKDILVILLISGICFSIYLIGYYGVDGLMGVFGSHARFGEEINNANVVGMELAMTALVAIYFGMSEEKKYYLLAIIPIILSLSTASKKAIICVILGIILLIILKDRGKLSLSAMVKKIVLPATIILMAVFVIQANVFPSLTKRLNYYSNSLVGEGKVDNSTEERNAFIEYGFMSFLDQPLIGVGLANSGQITMKAVGRDTYLHNNYVELLATIGVLGTAVYYYIFVSMLVFAIKNRRFEDASIVVMIFVLCLVLDWGMVSYYSKITYIYLLLGALFYSNANNHTNEKNEENLEMKNG